MRKPYLGDRAVVWHILTEMVETAASDPENTVVAIAETSTILTGRDDRYAPIGSWNAEGIGDWIRGHMNGVPHGDAYAVVEWALGHLVLHQIDAIRGVSDGVLSAQTAGYRMRLLINNWTSLMLGVPAHLVPLNEPDPDDPDEG